MATSQKLTDHFLSCTICTEVFDKPCTLVCNHTFCRKCIVNYTKTRPEAIRAKSLLCPFCRKMTKVSAPERPMEEWADDVKPIFLIQGLLDSFGPGSKDTTNCTYCQEHGETTLAVACCSVCDDALCEKCTGAHNRIPSFRNHDVTDLSGEVKVKGKRKAMCKEHKQESLEFLCQDCKKAVCQKCCILYHRKCDAVVTITSQMVTMKTELTEMKKSLSNKEGETTLRVKEQKLQEQRERDHYSLMKSHIHSACQKVIDRAKKKERKLLDRMEDISHKHIGQLKADIKTGEMSAGDVEAVGDADLKEGGRIASFTFRQDTDKLIKALDDLELGEIEVLYESVLDLKATPVLQDTIDITVAGDRSKPMPSDVTVLVVNDTDTVVVTDWYNHSMKSFYVKNNQTQHSKLRLSGDPWSVTKLTHDQVAVTVPDTQQIVTVKVKPDLELLTTMRTSKQYWGITSLTPSTLAAGSHSALCVDILDMTGNVLRSISSRHKGNNILQYPNFLSTRTGNILVSDWGTKRVVCLTPEGDVVFSYSPTGDTALECPRGITSTDTGDILVTDYRQHRVIHLTESGQFVRNILTEEGGITCPVGVCVDPSGYMYVCLGTKGVVKVFTCLACLT
ncbi:E3 ubiquitin/ISG15 ligase TRIM25-like [Haliotis rubra]|uniref:E3 ubiquitin/ISG15 ligase TRIM25-like n=1 Tax=Haliotis rubra TaxID=36100 RepID=UPI001EE5AC7D|nr:E3 ubiquitin/ISG15 ligase TRIM25-like [Haliotis rubra]